MAEVDVFIEGLDAYVEKLGRAPDKLLAALQRQAKADAETLAGLQREKVNVLTGQLRASIRAFCRVEGDRITAGSRTDCDHARYVEFGTGPVGDLKGHPLDAELGIVRSSKPWLVQIPGVGLRYTHGQPAQAFMYRSMKEMRPCLQQHYTEIRMEAFKP